MNITNNYPSRYLLLGGKSGPQAKTTQTPHDEWPSPQRQNPQGKSPTSALAVEFTQIRPITAKSNDLDPKDHTIDSLVLVSVIHTIETPTSAKATESTKNRYLPPN